MKNKILLLSLTLVGLSVLLGGCSLYDNTARDQDNSIISDPSQNINIPIAPTVQTDSGQIINTILIQDFAFNPGVINIKKGDTVSWINKDTAPHVVESSAFVSDTLSTGQSFSYIFNEAGTFDYICTLHPSMKGQIIVE